MSNINFKHFFIINELLSNWNQIEEAEKIFDLFIENFTQINYDNILIVSIENNNLYVFVKTIKNVKLKQEHIDLLNKYKRKEMSKLIKTEDHL